MNTIFWSARVFSRCVSQIALVAYQPFSKKLPLKKASNSNAAFMYSFKHNVYSQVARYLLLLLVTLFPSLALSMPGENAIIYNQDIAELDLRPYVQYFEDSENQISSITMLNDDLEWKVDPSGRLNFGYTDSTFWFRINIENTSNNPLDLVLYLNAPSPEHLDWFFFENGLPTTSHFLGASKPFSTRLITHRRFVVPHTFPANSTTTLYIRMLTQGPAMLPLSLWEKKRFFSSDSLWLLSLGLYIGAMLLMMAYNTILYNSIRDRIYLHYNAFITTNILIVSGMHGLNYQYLWPDNPSLEYVTQSIFFPLYSFFLIRFTALFLDTKNNAPKLHKALMSANAYTVLLIIFVFYIPHNKFILMTGLFLSMTLSICAGIYTLSRGLQWARYMVLGWALLLIGVLVTTLALVGVIPDIFVNTIMVGTILETLSFSFALADRESTEKKNALDQISKSEHKAIYEKERANVIQQKVFQEALAAETERQSNIEKSRFLAAASHDLRQPLSALNMYIHALALKTKSMEPSYKHIVSQIGETSTSLNELLDGLLDVSRMDVSSIEPEFQPMTLTPLIQSIVDEVSEQASNKGLELIYEPSHAAIFSDPTLLGRILRNLVTNAIKFTEVGSVKITEKVIEDHVTISVMDTGIGIPENEMNNVFSEFHQISNKRRNRKEGVGLGLSIVSKLCEVLGSEIKVQSTLGQGSTFEVQLPLSKDSLAQPELSPAIEVTSLADISVLVLDDESDILEATVLLLEEWGCACLTSENVSDALRHIEFFSPDIILCDYGLQEDINGVEAIQKLRTALNIEVPAIIITGETSIKNIPELTIPVLQKPIDPVKLSRLMQDIVNKETKSS